jgi:hypothetical protein
LKRSTGLKVELSIAKCKCGLPIVFKFERLQGRRKVQGVGEVDIEALS